MTGKISILNKGQAREKAGANVTLNSIQGSIGVLRVNSFPGHRGRPGEKGGSKARDDSSGVPLVTERMGHTLIGKLLTGGFSESIDGISPQSGFMTAVTNQSEFRIEVEKVNDEIISDYARKNFADLLGDDRYLGGWLDKDKKTGQVYAYLDTPKNIQNMGEALDVAISAKQLAIYDVVNDRSIYIDYQNNNLPYYWKDKEEIIRVYI